MDKLTVEAVIKIDEVKKDLALKLELETIQLEQIAGTKGGWRYFFTCPMCQRRCRVLYRRLVYFGCGRCQAVYKDTLNRNKQDCQYYWGLAIREMKKIDPRATLPKGYVDYDDFPDKPKRMRWKTYLKHQERFLKYVDKGVKLWLEGCSDIRH